MTGLNHRKNSRRDFLRSTATAAFGGALAGSSGFPAVLAGPTSTQTLRVGLIGCGGRGSGLAGAFAETFLCCFLFFERTV